MDSFEEFIIRNAVSDTSRLILSCKEWPEPSDSSVLDPEYGLSARDLAVNTIEARKKLARKVPQWHSVTALVYPTTLCAEQCSSTETSLYKASLAGRILSETGCNPDKSAITDLTGGLGIDSWAFSKVADKVLYNEMNPLLARAARHNFPLMGMSNVLISSEEVSVGKVGSILSAAGASSPGIIFLDPARRAKDGKKVFLLEDCQPDVLKLIPELFAESRNILLKLSPMADISMAVERLNTAASACTDIPAGRGRCVREVHIVAAGGECKELLIWMDREYEGCHRTICCEDGNTICFDDGSDSSIEKNYDAGYGEAPVLDSTGIRLLFEPGKSLTKAGMFGEIGKKFFLAKLGRFTHLYTDVRPLSDEELKGEAARLKPFGKVFEVKEVLPLNKASMKDVGKRFPHSEVSARNIPLSSDELRARLKVQSGDDAHIFGVRIDLPYGSSNWILVCKAMFLPENA